MTDNRNLYRHLTGTSPTNWWEVDQSMQQNQGQPSQEAAPVEDPAGQNQVANATKVLPNGQRVEANNILDSTAGGAGVQQPGSPMFDPRLMQMIQQSYGQGQSSQNNSNQNDLLKHRLFQQYGR